MKRLVIIGSIALWLGYITANSFLSGFTAPRADSILFSGAAITAVVNSSTTLGNVLANVADPATEPGRRYFRRLLVGFAVLLAVSILAIVIGGVVRQAPPWVPTAMIALTILCSVGPVAAAEHYRRRLRAEIHSPSDWRIGSDDRRRTFRTTGLTFAIATAAVLTLLAVLSGTTDLGDLSIPEIVGFSLGVGAISAGVPTLAASWRLTTSTNLIFGTDIESRKAVSMVVLRGKPGILTSEQQLMATEFAHVWREFVPIQLAQGMGVASGVILINSPALLRGDVEPWLVAAVVLVGVGLVLGIIVGRHQYRRIQQYAQQHPLVAATGP